LGFNWATIRLKQAERVLLLSAMGSYICFFLPWKVTVSLIKKTKKGGNKSMRLKKEDKQSIRARSKFLKKKCWKHVNLPQVSNPSCLLISLRSFICTFLLWQHITHWVICNDQSDNNGLLCLNWFHSMCTEWLSRKFFAAGIQVCIISPLRIHLKGNHST